MVWQRLVLGLVLVFLVAGCVVQPPQSQTRVLPHAGVADEPPVLDQNQGDDLIVFDQSIADSAVVISKAPGSFTGWVVVGPIEDDNPGPVKGHQATKPGQNTSLRVALNPDLPAGVYYVILHYDNGQTGVFEYPGGPDGPVRVDGGLFMVTFRILPN